MWRELRRPGIFIRAAACLTTAASLQRNPSMGFNKRKMKAQRAAAAEKVAAAKRATEAQILEDASRLVSAWNERQAKRMPMLFSPTIGCALKARHWFTMRSVQSRGTMFPSLSIRSANEAGCSDTI